MDYDEKRKNLLKNLMQDLRRKMSCVDPLSIEDELKKKNICENEKIVISKILKAFKCKSRMGHRYSDEWLILCLILHMKSPATYRLLRETNMLPLPCRSSIKNELNYKYSIYTLLFFLRFELSHF